MKTYMFPGQGSQARGMGGRLFDEFSELAGKADEILGYSIKELCLSDPRRELGRTQFTQPALYVVNALSYQKALQEAGAKPDYVAGHSLGEFNALFAAECIDFETGLKLVKKRGELMSQATDGAMAAIINATREEVEALLKENGFSNIDVANYNTPLQIVISGPTDEIASSQNIFQSGKVMYVPLNTSGAFHSRLMIQAAKKFESSLKKYKFAAPKIPVIANLTATPYPDTGIAGYLTKQIHSTVLWSDTIQHLMGLSEEMEFVEIGHGDVLTKMIPKIRQFFAKARSAASIAPAAAESAAGRATEAEVVQATSEPKRELPAVPAITRAETERAAPELPREAPLAPGSRFADAEKRVAAWNRSHPIGTKVKSLVTDYEELSTRTPAIVLFGHRAAVYMEGYNGYFDLAEIVAA